MKKRSIFALFLSLLLMLSFFNVDVNAIGSYDSGVYVELNSDKQYEAKYQATFTYKNDDKAIDKVEVIGGFQFYLDNSPEYYDVFEYKDGMYPGGYEYDTSEYTAYLMENVNDGIYQVKLPLPANQYFYKYRITYQDGTVEEIKDPANMPIANGDSDANWSLFYVGSKDDAFEGQEYIYPRDDHQGRFEFVEYDAVDGTKQPLGVYLPFNYDKNKIYKTIYISHGGWGNEVEWLTIGSVNNIMDNLIADGLTQEAIVVTMDNEYFGFDATKTVDNLTKNIIPFIESKYSVSHDKDDRAMCGLSAGGTVTCNTLVYANDSFGYYGVWSPRDTVLAPLIENGTISEDIYQTYKDATYHIGVGNLDIELRQQQEKILHDTLTNIVGADSTFEYVNGTHDWFVWRNLFTNFAKNILWSNEIDSGNYDGGVVVDINNDSQYESKYQATFTYIASDDVSKVELVGGFQFYSQADADKYMQNYDASTISSTSAYDYKDGMFATGYDVTTGETLAYEMKMIDNNVYSITLPLPANEYYYGYEITYNDGTVETIEDPANPSIKNGDNDATWSYFFVGNNQDCQKGQEYIYPRNDGNNGTYSYVSYKAIDGTMQPLGIYLPKDYSDKKTYKTIYLSHGADGNETEWFQLGAAVNIMDNLIAEGLTEEAIVVTMNNTYFNDTIVWDWNLITNNLMNYIIPFIEENYSVSKDAKDRAMCGLSNGSRFASSILYTNAQDFSYIGMFSRALTDVDLTKCEGIKDTNIYFSIGSLEYNKDIDTWRQMMKDANIDYTYELYNAAHDWNMWRASFTTFVKDICWKDDQNVDVIDKTPTVNNQNNKPVSSVKTGDDQNIILYGLGLLTGITGLGYSYKKRKMSKKVM